MCELCDKIIANICHQGHKLCALICKWLIATLVCMVSKPGHWGFGICGDWGGWEGLGMGEGDCG